MDVVAYFLGAIAAVTLTIASLHYSNLIVALRWFWLTGILGVSSGAFFWAARERSPVIRWVWVAGILVVSVAWWILEPKKPTVVKATPTPVPALETPSPLMQSTPIIAPSITATAKTTPPLRFTPKQIVEKIRREPSNQDATAKAFKGLSVDWTLFFALTLESPNGKSMTAAFRSGEKEDTALVSFGIPVTGNEHFPLTETTQKFRIRGVIDEVHSSKYIFLRDNTVSFEPVP